MTKIQRPFFLSLMLCILAWNTIAAESAFFDQKDEGFWVLKNKMAFTEAARTLIDDEGNWKGQPPVPQYIKFSEALTTEDLPTLQRWLSLKELTCFAIADRLEQPNLKLIHSWFSELRERDVNLQTVNFNKLAWLNFKSTLTQLGRGEASILSADSIETNRAFQMMDSHYFPIVTH